MKQHRAFPARVDVMTASNSETGLSERSEGEKMGKAQRIQKQQRFVSRFSIFTAVINTLVCLLCVLLHHWLFGAILGVAVGVNIMSIVVFGIAANKRLVL